MRLLLSLRSFCVRVANMARRQLPFRAQSPAILRLEVHVAVAGGWEASGAKLQCAEPVIGGMRRKLSFRFRLSTGRMGESFCLWVRCDEERSWPEFGVDWCCGWGGTEDEPPDTVKFNSGGRSNPLDQEFARRRRCRSWSFVLIGAVDGEFSMAIWCECGAFSNHTERNTAKP